MAEITFFQIVQIVLLAWSIQRQQEMQRRMAAMQDAQKGFEFTTEGESAPVPVVYGRNLIGGSRVYHKTSGNYNHAGIGSNAKEFVKSLTSSQDAGKNDFLFFQQVLAHGEISAVHEMVIDDARFFSNSDFDPGLRANVYLAGNQADPMMTANFSERSTATFTDLAYASICLKLNRDEPQFNGGVPQIQFMIDGLKVNTIIRTGAEGSYSYSLSTSKSYSNNPAYCLLDYLLSSKYGRGISVNQIDLASFYNAAQVCNTIVRSNVELQGNIWKPSDGSRNIINRNLPLYECNITLDTTVAVRDNITSLLETMKGAELLWSSGKYKLLLQYPASNNDIQLAGTITDDDLLRDTISIKWPSASERLNYVTVKYKNEAVNFKEDTVSWPPKTGTVFTTFRNEDNGVPLESEFFEPGIKDYYHALSKAEERVRRSRYSVIYSFTTRIKGAVYEPGDIIRLESTILDIPYEYLQIQSIKFNEDYTASIEAVRFDSQMLAWNVDDNEPSKVIPSYSFTLSPPTNLSYLPYTGSASNYAYGILQWIPPEDDSANSYLIEYKKSSDALYTQIGETTGISFEIFGFAYGYYDFRVRSKSLGGNLSTYSQSISVLISDSTDFSPFFTLSDDVVLTNGKIDSRLIIDIVSEEPPFFLGYETEVKLSSSPNDIWISLGISKSTRVIFPGVIDNELYEVRVRIVNALGNVGSYTTDTRVIIGKTAAPSIPFNLVAIGGYKMITLRWVNPSDADFSHVEIYRNTVNNSSGSSLIAIENSDSWIDTGLDMNVTRYYWLRAVDLSGNKSDLSSGVSANTEFIDSASFSAEVINLFSEAGAYGIEPVSVLPSVGDFEGQIKFDTVNHKLWRWDPVAAMWTDDIFSIEAGTVDAASFTEGIEPISIVTSLPRPIEYTGPLIVFNTSNNKIYRYTGSEWTSIVPATDISGQVTNAQIEALAASKITGTLTNEQIAELNAIKITGQISSTQISDGAISTPKLATGAVTANTIAANSITSAAIQSGAITTAKLAAGAVTANEIAANTITASNIAANTITGTKIAADTITSANIAANAITASELASDSVIAGKIAAGAINTSALQANIINSSHIQAGTISGDRIAANTITGGLLATSGIITTSAQISNAVIDNIVAKNIAVGTGTSGARLVMTNTYIKVYDAAGTLRVQIGDLSV